jgi:hypothetical protein
MNLYSVAATHGERGRSANGVRPPSRFFRATGLYWTRTDPTWRIPPMMIADVQVLKQRIYQLNVEHRDLDDVISRLSQSAAQDQLQLQRLKKRKLLIKDQITMLERQLTPDIPA